MPLPSRPIRLIAIDLDYTLLNARHQVSPGNENALREAAAKGVAVAIASGRIFGSARRFSLLHCGQGQPYLSSNGGAVGYNDRDDFLSLRLMDDDAAEVALDAALKLGCDFHAHTLQNEMVHLDTPYKRRYHQGRIQGVSHDGGACFRLLPETALRRAMRGQTLKLVVRHDEKAVIAAYRQSLKGLPLAAFSSDIDNVEVNPAGVDKGFGVRMLADKLGLSLSEVMVLGDNENDLSMFRVAGWPVAMQNATPEIKAVAAAITDTDYDHDGVAGAIRRYVLSRE